MAVDPRESMRPIWPSLQPFLTRLTGRPLEHQVLRSSTSWGHLGGCVCFLACGVALSSTVVAMPVSLRVPVVLLGWLLTLHGARKLRTIIMHQAAHRNFTRNEHIDRLVGKAISIILITEEFDTYRKSHCADHHSSRHQTIDDPTVAFLFHKLGLRPGQAPGFMWKRLLWTVVSPKYHFVSFAERLRSHFQRRMRAHAAAMCLYLAAVLLAVTFSDLWIPFLVIWAVPTVILYQVSTAFRLSSEHVFPPHLPLRRNRDTIGAYTLGIFCGTPAPDPAGPRSGRLLRWAWWWIEMIGFHLPCRLAFLPGDGPVHDWHHRHPMNADWANYISNRDRDSRYGEGRETPYREVWGFHHAIDACFRSLSAASPSDYLSADGDVDSAVASPTQS